MSQKRTGKVVGRHTESVGNVDLIKVTTHDSKGCGGNQGQIKLGQEAGFFLGNIERYDDGSASEIHGCRCC